MLKSYNAVALVSLAVFYVLTSRVACFLYNIKPDDVGVDRESKKQKSVSHYLNRLLGMNMSRQKLMTNYFLKSLENVVSSAKRAGTYDVGIRTLTGNNIEVSFKTLTHMPPP